MNNLAEQHITNQLALLNYCCSCVRTIIDSLKSRYIAVENEEFNKLNSVYLKSLVKIEQVLEEFPELKTKFDEICVPETLYDHEDYCR